MLEKLNQNQQQAVLHKDGPIMVLAGPGSGKTTVITYRALHLVQHHGVNPANMLVLTYSKAAAMQMETRFNRLCEGDKLPVTFGTFHATLFRALRRHKGYTLEQVLPEGARKDIVRTALREMDIPADDEMMLALLNEVSLVKNELHDMAHYASQNMGADDFRRLFDCYEVEKQRRGCIDFDDMLSHGYRLLKEDAAVRAEWQRQYPYIMVDEFQDVNFVQYETMRLLSGPPFHLCIVGDDDQSIYRFRGARPEFLLKFPQDFPDAQQITLATNYRSTDTIIGFSNRLIAENKVRYPKDIVGTQREGRPPVLLFSEDQNREAINVASKIKKLDNYADAAVIYRTNIQSRALTDALMQANIPFTVRDEASTLYEHWVAQDMAAYLRQQPEDVLRIVNKPFRFISKAFLQWVKQKKVSLLDAYELSGMLNTQQKQRVEELRLYLNGIKNRTTAEAIRYLRKGAGYDTHLKEYAEYRKMSPAGLYEIAAELQASAEAFPDPADWLAHMEAAIAAAKETPKDDTPRVTLTTMHSAKGLEFDTVYIAGAVEGLIPHQHSKTEVEMEEERRLFYVGATRAKKNLYISVIKKRHEQPVEPSRFIKNFKRGGAKWESFQKKYGNVKDLLRQ